MARSSVEHAGVNVGSRAASKAFEEVVYQFRLQIADQASSNFGVDHGRRASAEIHGSHSHCLVHRHQKISRSKNAAIT